MEQIFYATPTLVISLVLMGLMIAFIEFGYRAGSHVTRLRSESFRNHVNGVQSAMLGLLALLLAFTFSLALQRFETRSEAVVNETNAIGTAFLRAAVLPDQFIHEARVAVSRYLDVRVEETAITLSDRSSLDTSNRDAAEAQVALWDIAVQAVEHDGKSQATLLFMEATNELIDSFRNRTATLIRHVPELVLVLLFVTFLLAGAIVGFAAGTGSHRPALATYMLVGLMVGLIFIILELDRPRRGIIRVNHSSLYELQATLHAEIRQAAGQRASAKGQN